MSSFHRLGLLGKNIQHSLSPFIHEYWLRIYGLQGSYILLDWDEMDLRKKVSTLALEGFVGVNVTMPYKTTILKYLDEKDMDLSVSLIKAANTLTVQKNGGFRAHNTDILGLLDVLTQNSLFPQKVIIYGAGGAACAVAYALTQHKVKGENIFVVARTPEKVRKSFSPTINIVDERAVQEISESADLLINASPLGMVGHPPFSPVLSKLSKKANLMDLVYHPRLTQFLKEGKSAGFQTIDGLELLLAQARHSFNHWFQILPEVTSELRTYIEQKIT